MLIRNNSKHYTLKVLCWQQKYNEHSSILVLCSYWYKRDAWKASRYHPCEAMSQPFKEKNMKQLTYALLFLHLCPYQLVPSLKCHYMHAFSHKLKLKTIKLIKASNSIVKFKPCTFKSTFMQDYTVLGLQRHTYMLHA